MSSQLISIFTQTTALSIAQGLTITSIGLFAGVALSYNAIIMPSLRKTSNENALPVWAHAYHTGMNLQRNLILSSFVSGAGVYFYTGNSYYLTSSLIMTSIVPYTLKCIMPVNNTLLGILNSNKGVGQDGQLEGLFNEWNRLHSRRTLMSLIALGLTLYGTFASSAL
ncbi:hypothetical protein BGX26_008864 [Mortierella sp. AD094]|nr:hypothetical protein BGX26_008864 [Mortierella sp. AD094]